MPNDPFKIASEALGKAIDSEKRNRKLLDAIGPAIIQALRPTLERIESAVSRIKVDVKPIVQVNPQTKAPEVTVNVPDFPDIPTPIVNYTPPAIKIPEIKMPSKMNIEGWVGLMGVSLEKPLPVQLRNADGSPVNLLENLTTLVSGGGGSRGIVKVSGFDGSAYSLLQNGDGRVKVSVESGGGALTDTELRATAVPVSQVSGANWSVSVTDVTAVNLDIRDLDNATDSVRSYQLYGASWSVTANANSGVDIGDVDILSIAAGDNNIGNVDILTIAAGDNNIGNVDIVTMPTVTVTGALDTVKSSGIARTTNPTAVSDGDNQRISTDDLGRTLTRPIQVRDLIASAYVTITTGIETTLLSATAGAMYDLIYIMAANASGAA